MPDFNKSIVAQPGSGMSFMVNALADAPGAKLVVVDVGQSSETFLSAPPRSGMSVLHNEQMWKETILASFKLLGKGTTNRRDGPLPSKRIKPIVLTWNGAEGRMKSQCFISASENGRGWQTKAVFAFVLPLFDAIRATRSFDNLL